MYFKITQLNQFFQRSICQCLPCDWEIHSNWICCQIHQEKTSRDVTSGRRSWRHSKRDSHFGGNGTRECDLSSSGLREWTKRHPRPRTVSFENSFRWDLNNGHVWYTVKGHVFAFQTVCYSDPESIFFNVTIFPYPRLSIPWIGVFLGEGGYWVFFIYLVLALLRNCSLCWDHWEVVQTPHTNQALP